MKQLVVYYVPTYMPVSKLTYKRHKNQIMTDDRSVRDENRDLSQPTSLIINQIARKNDR
jgi:hypothetical protein